MAFEKCIKTVSSLIKILKFYTEFSVLSLKLRISFHLLKPTLHLINQSINQLKLLSRKTCGSGFLSKRISELIHILSNPIASALYDKIKLSKYYQQRKLSIQVSLLDRKHLWFCLIFTSCYTEG